MGFIERDSQIFTVPIKWNSLRIVLLLLVAWFGGEDGDVVVCLILAGVEVSEPVHSVAAACRRTACPLLAGGEYSTDL